VRYNISQDDGTVVSPADGGGTIRIQGTRMIVLVGAISLGTDLLNGGLTLARTNSIKTDRR
jgi:hypothetical protein